MAVRLQYRNRWQRNGALLYREQIKWTHWSNDWKFPLLSRFKEFAKLLSPISGSEWQPLSSNTCKAGCCSCRAEYSIRREFTIGRSDSASLLHFVRPGDGHNLSGQLLSQLDLLRLQSKTINKWCNIFSSTILTVASVFWGFLALRGKRISLLL